MKIVVLEPEEPDSSGIKKIERISALLENSGHEVLRQTANSGMIAFLMQSVPEVVFNLASIYGWERTNLVPAVLEIAGMRYTGSNLLSLSLARNYTKRFPLLLASGVPMVEFAVMKAGEAAVPSGYDFPLTLYCDGVYDEMTINSQVDLKKALKDYPPREDLVLQKMVSGRKSSIYILDSAPFLPPEDPAYLEPALKAYELLEARGLARFDFVESGSFYLDEIDLCPDPLDEGFLQVAAEHGLDEAGILRQLLKHAGQDLPSPRRRGSYLLKKAQVPAEKIIIRPLEWNDPELEQILEIDALCFNEYDAYSLEDYRRWFNYDQDLCLVAVIGDRIAGDVISRIVDGRAELASMATHPSYQRRGVAEALLVETVRRIRSRGIPQIDIEVRKTNFIGLSFWKKMGFEVIGENPAFYGDGEDAWQMRKIIT